MASSFPAPAPTKHLLFRPLHPTDAPRLASIANCPSISKWMLNTFPSPYTLSSAEGFIARCALPVDETKSVDWAICLHSLPLPGSEPDPEPPLIGVCGLKLGSDVHAHQAIVGYWISPAYQGRKFGREMLAGLVEWAWRTEGLVRAREGGVEVDGEGKPVMLGRLAAEVFGGNDASVRLLTRAWFRIEGKLRGAVFKGGVVRDLWVFGLLRGERERTERERREREERAGDDYYDAPNLVLDMKGILD